jgi:hypothetical protein
MCLEQVMYYLTLKDTWIFSYCRLDEYLGKMVVLIDRFTDEDIKKKYASEIYKIIKDNNLHEFIFSEEFGRQIYAFISIYTLTFIQNIPDYIYFHK